MDFDKNGLESLLKDARLLEEFRHTPFKVLFGTEAKRRIGKIYLLDPDEYVKLESLKYENKDELMNAINELYVLDILEKREVNGVAYYHIKDSLMGQAYKRMINSVLSMVTTVTEVEEHYTKNL